MSLASRSVIDFSVLTIWNGSKRMLVSSWEKLCAFSAIVELEMAETLKPIVLVKLVAKRLTDWTVLELPP